MKLSIITVAYNNYSGLEATIASVESQTRKDFEFIIVDGGSDDGSIELIRQHEKSITKWVSESDSGIYHAMNKGVQMASGDYCLFMNAGDRMYALTTVEELHHQDIHADFVEGIITFDERPGTFSNPPETRTIWSYIYGVNNCHQASLIKRSLLLRVPYDETYRIAADLKFNMQTIVCMKCSYQTIGVVVCNYQVGGVSATVSHKDEVDRIFKELFPTRWILFRIARLKIVRRMVVIIRKLCRK